MDKLMSDNKGKRIVLNTISRRQSKIVHFQNKSSERVGLTEQTSEEENAGKFDSLEIDTIYTPIPIESKHLHELKNVQMTK